MSTFDPHQPKYKFDLLRELPRRSRAPGWWRFNDAPPSAGVYRLEHQPSGYLYVGSSINLRARREQWVHVFAALYAKDRPRRRSLFGAMSDRFQEVARALDFDGWSFALACRVPNDVPLRRLFEAEEAEIQRALSLSPALLLNDHRRVSYSPASLQGGLDELIGDRLARAHQHRLAKPRGFGSDALQADAFL